MPTLLDGLPKLYANLLPPLFKEPIPAEEKATCSNCAMCAPKDGVDAIDGVSRFFKPDAKCCTYHPRLPNYLVGGLLSDPSPEWAEGQRRMRAKLTARIGVTPQWMRAPAKYNLLYNNARNAFGRADALICPFFEKDGGLCTIWPYREAVCSTYYCKYVAGADGRAFWMGAKTFLSLVEAQLSRHAMLEIAPELLYGAENHSPFGADPPLTSEALDDLPVPEKDHRRLWKEWTGREEEFYRRCHEVASKVTWPELEKLLGMDGKIELELLRRKHYAATVDRLPKTLKFNPAATVTFLGENRLALACYSEIDGVALPAEAHSLLVHFNGKQPVDAVRNFLRRELSQDLSDEILITLYRHRILIEVS